MLVASECVIGITVLTVIEVGSELAVVSRKLARQGMRYSYSLTHSECTSTGRIVIVCFRCAVRCAYSSVAFNNIAGRTPFINVYYYYYINIQISSVKLILKL